MSRLLRTQLKDAIKSYDIAKAEDLLEKLDIEAINKKINRMPPIHWACQKFKYGDTISIERQVKLLELILDKDGIDVNAIDDKGFTPLHEAITNRNIVALERLLAFPGVNVNVKSDKGYTPLHTACDGMPYYRVYQKKLIVPMLFSSPGIDINAKDCNGETPLHKACKNNHHEVVNILLANPGIDVNVKDNWGNTPIVLATDLNLNEYSIEEGKDRVWYGVVETFKLMLDDPRINLDFKNNEGDGLEDVISMLYNNAHDKREQCLEMLKAERMRRNKRKMEKEQQSQDETIAVCMDKIEKINDKISEEEKRQKNNSSIRGQKMDHLNERQHLEKVTLDTKHKNEKITLVKRHQDETKMLKSTLAREQEDEQRYLRVLNERRNDLNQEIEKLNIHQGNAVLGAFDCPICMELMRPPTRIWMCRLTHIICESCKDQLCENPCPTCTTEKVDLRAFVVENIARTFFND